MPPTESSSLRNRIGGALLALAFAFLAGAIIYAMRAEEKSLADPDNAQQVALGKPIYERHCASCHGAKLEGQANWREKMPNGRMPAPPHDETGHTWHHPDAVLFGITKDGLVPGRYAPPGYQSDMPAYRGILSDDEIWAVLSYIKSIWPTKVRVAQREIDRERRKR